MAYPGSPASSWLVPWKNVTMQTAAKKSGTESLHLMRASAKEADIASASIPATLAALQVNPDTGLTRAEVDLRRKAHGYNETAERKEHPALSFLTLL